MIRIEVERFSLTTSKPFDEVVAVINAAIGHPEMAKFAKSTHEATLFYRPEKRSRERLKQSRLDTVYAA